MSMTQADDLRQLTLIKAWSEHLDRKAMEDPAETPARPKPSMTTHYAMAMAYDIAQWVMRAHERRHHDGLG